MTSDTFFLSSPEKNKSSLIHSSTIFSASFMQPMIWGIEAAMVDTHWAAQCLLTGTGKRHKPLIKESMFCISWGKDRRLCKSLVVSPFPASLGIQPETVITERLGMNVQGPEEEQHCRKEAESLQRFEGLQRQTLNPNFGVFPALWWGKCLSE